jgi:hypothetical protein
MQRPDKKFIPGDWAFLSYDIENLRMDRKTSKVVYGLRLRMTNSKGDLVFEDNKNNNVEVFNALASTVQPAIGFVEIGQDQPPGTYVMSLTVTDRLTKKSAEYTTKFQVLKKTFGFVKIQGACLNMVGPDYRFRFGVTGFQRDSKKLPKVFVKLLIRDENNKPTLLNAVTMRIPGDMDLNPEDVHDELGFPLSFPLNRVGRFTLKLEARDLIGDKTVKLDYHITVLDPRKYESGGK